MNIFITGASKGIGKATAIRLSESGHMVVGTSRSAQSWADEYDNITMLTCDVKDYASVQKTVTKASEIMGGIDAVVNNAGLGYFDPLLEGKIEQWNDTIDTNVKGLLNVVHCTMHELADRKGQVINLGSVASHQVFPNSGVYCASKWAVLAISQSIRMELEGKVRVTTISPGAVNTEFVESSDNEELLKDYRPYFASAMSPDTIAQQIVHAIETPPNVVISEIIVRPNRQNK